MNNNVIGKGIDVLKTEVKTKHRFFFLKMVSEPITRYWLGLNESGPKFPDTPHLAVYFGSTRAEDIRKRVNDGKAFSEQDIKDWLKDNEGGTNWEDLRNFFLACERDHEEVVIVVFTSDQVFFLEPDGAGIRDLETRELKEHLEYLKRLSRDDRRVLYGKEDFQKPKVCKVRGFKYKYKWDTPFVLATSNAYRGLNQRTFREYKCVGHRDAISHCLELDFKKPENGEELLIHLGPVELETLVFLNFHERGFHVPANRGSTIPDVDIVVKSPNTDLWNDDLFSRVIHRNNRSLFQVKIEAKRSDYRDLKKKLPDANLITLTHPKDRTKGWLGPDWLLRLMSEAERCRERLETELEWLGLNEDEWRKLHSATK